MAKMKNIQIAILSIALGLAACGEDPAVEDDNNTEDEVTEEVVTFKNASVEEFGQTLIASFRTGDVELFKQLAIEQEALIQHIQNTVEDDSAATVLVEGVTGNAGLWEAFKFNDETFNSLIEVGGKLGVKWDMVEFESVDVNVSEMDGLKQANGKIIFNSSGKRYEFIIIECHELADGWYGMGLQVEESMLQEEDTSSEPTE